MHANTAQKKFSDTFFKEFGKPADGHQWGFDIPWMDKYLTRANTRAEVYKADGQDQCLPGIATYGVVPNITEKEHQEVYEWFSTHRVEWTTKTVNYKQPEDLSFIWRMMKDGAFVDQQNSENVFGDCIVKTVGDDIVEGSKIEGDFMIIKKQENPNGEISQRAGNNTRKDGVTIAYAYNGGTPSTNSIYTYTPDKIGDTPIGITIDFDGAWIQHVAGDLDSSIPDYCKEKTSFGADVFASDNYNADGSLKSVGMDQLYFYDPNHDEIHVYDFNGCKGWGWNRQSVFKDENGKWLTNTEFQAIIKKAYDDAYQIRNDQNDANNAAQAKFNELVGKYCTENEKPGWFNNAHTGYLRNGTLVLGADFSQTTYKSSKAEQKYFEQDKWIIVYLKGEGYEGWYLGFDLESAGDSKDKLVEANGFCNNWIIKLTAVNTAVSTEPIRIMCEDLGGEANEVHIGDKVHISDIDYNDIVLDVTPNADYTVTLTLQAAGGTIPLTVWYAGKPLFETHEMFQRGKSFKDNDHKKDIDYSIMYNTQGENRATTTDNQPAKVYTLNGPDQWNNFNANNKFDINKLEIKVWRLDSEVYKESAPNDFSNALWINISNIAGQAPLKICVNQKVPWLKERCSIKDGYPKFRVWVQDPSKLFWGSKETPNIIDYSDKAVKEFLVVKK